MPYKKKATPGTVQFNKSIAELPEKREYQSTDWIQTWSFRIAKKS